jgi:hypothetical protein
VVEVTIVVAVWIALGLVFWLSVNGYQLLGVFLIPAFQRIVRRQPFRTLWLRDAPRFRLDTAGWCIALLLEICPAYHVVQDL